METKICTKCGKEKSLDNFYKSSFTKDGYKCFCKQCKLEYERKYQEDPRYRERRLEHKRQYGKDNAKQLQKAKKAWYEREPWRKTHKSIMSRCYCGNHWYKERGIENHLTPENLKELWFRDKAYDMKKPSIDRVDPSKDYTFENCRYIEYSENVKKQSTEGRS